MKLNRNIILAVAVALAAACSTHAESVVGGPKGGRLLDTKPNRAEFFVMPDRRVEIAFYDEALKPVAPGTQVVTATAEAPGGRVALEFEATGAGVVSKAPLPPGEPYRVVVQVRAAAGEKPQNFRIDLNLSTCGECSRVEYACTCEGH